MKSLKLCILAIICISFHFSNAQQTPTQEPKQTINDGTIDDKFEYVLRKSGNFKGTNGAAYEAVQRNMFLRLKAHTNDTINTLKKNLSDTKTVVSSQAKEIEDLKHNLSSTQSNLNATNDEKNNMALLGMQTSKTNYNIIMWSIIGGLLALLLFFIYKFKNSNAITRKANHKLAEVEEEFDEHRKTALEREQKVRRQLQDEINKQKGNT
ncbi:tRNA (guanine-N1)-methyltransferase [Ichthyenterobacterium sp. W332]|uniref:tRNA (Guanine-N1)-methyltransferase n=1 Tax=Microcosmobacter mediterraneus TaxID=3075607 RepID=A0ABU2YH90_9FLAO|nr:tRNA (guanine-N1)-methyltransferase [Ichthyenterobacterium sp. W332]MDT0557508.1 tRNA (guanine-N1)-methyltransferase [Ichthyenterobacterium sp. W332]